MTGNANLKDLKKKISQLEDALENKSSDLDKLMKKNVLLQQRLDKQNKAFQFRNKEMGCILQLSRLGQKIELSLAEFIRQSLPIIQASFRNPDITCVEIRLLDQVHQTENFVSTPWNIKRGIMEKTGILGTITVHITQQLEGENPEYFIPQEKSLLTMIANYLILLIRRKDFEDRLQEFKEVISNSNSGIIMADEKGKAEYINKNALKILGYRLDDLLKTGNIFDLLNASGEEAFQDIRAQLGKSGVWKGELRINTESSGSIWTRVSISAIQKKASRIMHVAIFENITEEIKFRQEFLEQNERYWKVLENIPVSIVLTNFDGLILYVNRQAALNMNLSKQELQGQFLSDIFPDESPRTLKAIQTVFRINKSVAQEVSYVINNKKRYFDINRVPLLDREGNVNSVLSIAIEITERKHSDRLLQVQYAIDSLNSISDTLQGTLDNLFDNLFMLEWVDAGGIYIFNDDMTLLELLYYRGLSDEFISWASKYETKTNEVQLVLSKTPMFLAVNDSDTISREHLLKEGLRFLTVLPLIYKNTVIGSLNLASRKSKDLDNANRFAVESIAARVANLIALVKTNKQLIEKIEELKQKQQILEQKSKLESLGELAAGLAHEINQPLSVISLAFENIFYKLMNNKTQAEYFKKKTEVINLNIEKIRQLIDHIRLFSRDQSSVMFEKIDMNDAILNTLSLMEMQLNRHQIHISLDLCKENCNTLGNMAKIEQVIMNLLSNARDAVDEKDKILEGGSYSKKISISTRSGKDDIIMTVEDNGIGIKKENQVKIFNPFFTTKPPGQGTGLGLSIVYGIITEMNGTVEVVSNYNKFTRAKITLPRV